MSRKANISDFAGPKPIRVVLLAAAPMYYHEPLYRRVASNPRIQFKAVFASNEGVRPHDGGFGQLVSWDAELLSGYESRFLRRAATNPKSGNFFSLRDRDIWAVMREEQAEVLWLHGYNFLTHMMAASMQLVRRKPLLVREEQNLLNPRPLWKRVAKELGLRILLTRSHGLYIGSRNRAWFQHFGLKSDKLFFTPYSVDNDRLQAAERKLSGERTRLLASFGISPDSGPVILTVSRLVGKKQPQFILDAFRQARQRVKCNLLVVGSGELEQSLREKVQNEEIPDVHFAGFLNQSRIAEAYVCGDIFTLASRYDETWGLVVNEAMNFSLPIIVTNEVGCAPDLVYEGRNGYVVSSEDPNEMAAKFLSLLSDERSRTEFGNESKRIIDEWNHDVAAQGIADAVAHVVGKERWEKTSVSQSA